MYAAWRCMQTGLDVSCFITIRSGNDESYMFHTPNIDLTRLQAEAAGIPLIVQDTLGQEEVELTDLEVAIRRGVLEYQIEGVVTGAIQSVYQASRIERICHSLGLWCFSPLWLCDQEEYLNTLIRDGFEVIIAGVFAEPLDDSWLGTTIDPAFIDRLKKVSGKYHLSLAGEGGEYESFVCDAPFFKRRIVVTEFETFFSYGSGSYSIIKAECIRKGQ